MVLITLSVLRWICFLKVSLYCIVQFTFIFYTMILTSFAFIVLCLFLCIHRTGRLLSGPPSSSSRYFNPIGYRVGFQSNTGPVNHPSFLIYFLFIHWLFYILVSIVNSSFFSPSFSLHRLSNVIDMIDTCLVIGGRRWFRVILE